MGSGLERRDNMQLGVKSTSGKNYGIQTQRKQRKTTFTLWYDLRRNVDSTATLPKGTTVREAELSAILAAVEDILE